MWKNTRILRKQTLLEGGKLKFKEGKSKNFWALLINHIFVKKNKISKKKDNFRRGKVKVQGRKVKKLLSVAYKTYFCEKNQDF